MIKILLFILLVFFVITFLWVAAFHAFYRAAVDTYQSRPGFNPKVKAPESMVGCAHCGTYVPASECIHRSNRTYCSQEHADRERMTQPV